MDATSFARVKRNSFFGWEILILKPRQTPNHMRMNKNPTRKLAIIVLCLIIIGCKRNRDAIDSIPVLSDATLIEKKYIDGVPVTELQVSSVHLVSVVREYDKLLSAKWHKISDDSQNMQSCLEGSTSNQICGGSVSWMISNTNTQISLTIFGAPNSPGCSIVFHQFENDAIPQ